MKILTSIVMFMATQIGFAQSQNVYFTEDFQSVTGTPTTQLPAGWQNVNQLRVVTQGQNTFVVFGNMAANVTRSMNSSIQNIRPATALKMKLAYTTRNAQVDGQFSIYALENGNRQLLRTFQYAEILPKDADFEIHPLPEKFSKEIDLTAYQGKSIRFEFEILSPVVGSVVYLDEVELIENGTLSAQEIQCHQSPVTVYPNPASDVLYFSDIKFPAEVRVFSAEGKQVVHATINGSLSIAELPKGVYIVAIADAHHQYRTVKVLKK